MFQCVKFPSAVKFFSVDFEQKKLAVPTACIIIIIWARTLRPFSHKTLRNLIFKTSVIPLFEIVGDQLEGAHAHLSHFRKKTIGEAVFTVFGSCLLSNVEIREGGTDFWEKFEFFSGTETYLILFFYFQVIFIIFNRRIGKMF